MKSAFFPPDFRSQSGRERRRRRGVAALGQYANIGTVTANWSANGSSGTVTDSDASHYLGVEPEDEEEEEGEKVTLCHVTGAGRYVQIEVDKNAEPAHLAHGDGKPGAAVPGMAGKVFGAGCSVQ